MDSNVFKDMISSATASDEPIDTELDDGCLSAFLDAVHIPPFRYQMKDTFAMCVFDGDWSTYHDHVSLYEFATKFDCWILKPVIALAITRIVPEHNLITTLQLASRLDDFALALSAVENMDWRVFQAFSISTMAAALRPEWQIPFLRCVFEDSPGTKAAEPTIWDYDLAEAVPVNPPWLRRHIFDREVKKQRS